MELEDAAVVAHIGVNLRKHKIHVLDETDTDEDKEATPPQDIRDVKPVSIMFEILQRWDKSLAVFESLSS